MRTCRDALVSTAREVRRRQKTDLIQAGLAKFGSCHEVGGQAPKSAPCRKQTTMAGIPNQNNQYEEEDRVPAGAVLAVMMRAHWATECTDYSTMEGQNT